MTVCRVAGGGMGGMEAQLMAVAPKTAIVGGSHKGVNRNKVIDVTRSDTFRCALRILRRSTYVMCWPPFALFLASHP